LYEQGFADALCLPIIQISSTSLNDIPFDVRNNKTIQYEIGRSSKLKVQLAKEIKGVLQQKTDHQFN
jgi:hypothetical protein